MRISNTNSMSDTTFKKMIQKEREDERFEKALKDFRGDEDDLDWLTDDDLKIGLNVDLNELFSE